MRIEYFTIETTQDDLRGDELWSVLGKQFNTMHDACNGVLHSPASATNNRCRLHSFRPRPDEFDYLIRCEVEHELMNITFLLYHGSVQTRISLSENS